MSRSAEGARSGDEDDQNRVPAAIRANGNANSLSNRGLTALDAMDPERGAMPPVRVL